MSICPKCSKELEDGIKFCDACGAEISEPPVEPTLAASEEKAGLLQKITKKYLVLGGAVLAAIAVIVLVVCLLTGGKERPYALYLRDGEIFYSDFSKDGPVEISSRLLNGEDVDDEDLGVSNFYSLGAYIATRNNGKRIFYPDRTDSSADGITLYCRDLDKPEEEPIKIDSDVTSYAVNEDGTCVVYLKGDWDEGILYIHDLENKDKIASEVVGFYVSDDFKKVGYLTAEGSLYCWYAKKDKEKFSSDVEQVLYVADDLTVAYYMKDDALYRHEEKGNNKVKIASDISNVMAIYSTGEVYYTRSETVEISVMSYINDDMAKTDAQMKEPKRDTYSSYSDYMEAYDAYQDKLYRDYLRDYLEDETFNQERTSLYYYDGKKETLVAANIGRMEYSTSSAIMVVEACEDSNIRKIKASELDIESVYWGDYGIYEMINDVQEASLAHYLVIGGVKEEIEQTAANIYRYYIADDGSSVYFMDNISERHAELYKIAIVDGAAESPELYDSDVYIYHYSCYFVDENKLLYFKNVSDDGWTGDLYIDKKEIDYDVYVEPNLIAYEDGVIAYFTDWNSNKQYGTLKMYNGKEKTKVADDVHFFTIAQDGGILYLHDYSLNYYKGTLSLYKNGKREKVDDDVSTLLMVFDSKIMGQYLLYGW